MAILGFVFITAHSDVPVWKRFYTYVPPLLLWGAASAPVVASALHPALAPVGVLLAVFGYALGTYGGWLSGQLMRIVAPQ